jgi:Glyoxalase-like domain
VPTRMVHMVIDAAEPARLARFWAAALGWEMSSDGPEVANVLPPGYSYPDPVVQPLVLPSVPEPKPAKNRVHLNLATQSAPHQAAEVDLDVAPEEGEDLAGALRLLREAGALPADVGQRDVSWEVMADPEGNEFCVLTPR